MRFRTLTCFWLSCFVKTRRPNIHCRDAHFCRQQEQTCGQRQSSYTLNSTVARRNWRRRLQSSCRLDSQCSGDREEEEEEEEVMLLGCPVFGRMQHDNFAGFALYQRKAEKGWIMTFCTRLLQTWSKWRRSRSCVCDFTRRCLTNGP